MPLFDYVCLNRECPNKDMPYIELLVKNRHDVVECSSCKQPLEIVMTKGSYFHLKGSWPGKELSKKRGKYE